MNLLITQTSKRQPLHSQWRQQLIQPATILILIPSQSIQYQLFLQDSHLCSHLLSLQTLIIWTSLFISNMSREKMEKCITNKQENQCLINLSFSTHQPMQMPMQMPMLKPPQMQTLKQILKQQPELLTNLQAPINRQMLMQTLTQQQMQTQMHMRMLIHKQMLDQLFMQLLKSLIFLQQNHFL